MIHLLHGEDDLSRREAVRALLPAAGSDEAAALSVFEGNADVSSVIEACHALPFLSSRRYVHLRNLITASAKRTKRDGDVGDEGAEAAVEEEGLPARKRPVQVLRDALPSMPESTVLVLEESTKVAASSVLLKYAQAHGREVEFRPPQGSDLVDWINARFQAAATPVQSAAVRALITSVGSDLLQLDQEIAKLCAYAGGQQVHEQDVADMVPAAEEVRVWDMIDAAALGKPREALAQLRRLLADSANPPLRTLGAIVNRFRTMLLIKELVDQRQSDLAISRQTGVPDWSVRNTRPLVRALQTQQLTAIYQRLLDTDMVLKRSPIDDKLILELLVLDIATRNLSGRTRLPVVIDAPAS